MITQAEFQPRPFPVGHGTIPANDVRVVNPEIRTGKDSEKGPEGGQSYVPSVRSK